MLLSAASTTDSAIADSTQRDGRLTTPSAASDSVIECASVNAVTTFTTSKNAARKLAAGCQRRPATLDRTSTAGSSSDSRNRMWSKPVQMCQTPSLP